jgi:hypothetical protein
VGRIKRRLGKGGKTTPFKTITPPASLVKVARKLVPGRRRRRRFGLKKKNK